MTVYSTDRVDVALHDAGFTRLPSGAAVSVLPLWDKRHAIFARLGHGPAADELEAMGMRMPTVDEYAELHRQALHIDPYFLPLPEMISAAGVPKPWVDAAGRDTHAMATYRAENMRSLDWAELHDDEVMRLLELAGWTGEPVANAGKHWATHGGTAVLTGWWNAAGKPLQYASTFHLSEPEYTDYATTVHAAYDGERPELPPPSSSGTRDTDPAPTWHGSERLDGVNVGLRCVAWLGFQSQLGISEIPGPKHDARITAYSKHCRRGGVFLGVDGSGGALWSGKAYPLALYADEDPWCAAITSASLFDVLLVGERPPHGLRVSVREHCSDARIADTLRPADWDPLPGSLAICGRLGESPVNGGRGHIRRVVRPVAERYYGIGGNESDRIVAAWHAKADVLAWIDCSG